MRFAVIWYFWRWHQTACVFCNWVMTHSMAQSSLLLGWLLAVTMTSSEPGTYVMKISATKRFQWVSRVINVNARIKKNSNGALHKAEWCRYVQNEMKVDWYCWQPWMLSVLGDSIWLESPWNMPLTTIWHCQRVMYEQLLNTALVLLSWWRHRSVAAARRRREHSLTTTLALQHQNRNNS